jgi:hypothetical protein
MDARLKFIAVTGRGAAVPRSALRNDPPHAVCHHARISVRGQTAEKTESFGATLRVDFRGIARRFGAAFGSTQRYPTCEASRRS